MWSIVHRNQNKKHLLIFDLADENQFLLRLFWEFNFRYYTNAMIDYLVELLQGSPGFDKKILNACFCWPIQQQRNYLISKWNQLTYFKLGSVSTAYLLEDNVQKSFHNLGLLRKFKLSKFNFWEIQGIPQSWFDLVWWVELIEYLNPQQGWSPIMIIHIWIKFIKIDI